MIYYWINYSTLFDMFNIDASTLKNTNKSIQLQTLIRCVILLVHYIEWPSLHPSPLTSTLGHIVRRNHVRMAQGAMVARALGISTLVLVIINPISAYNCRYTYIYLIYEIEDARLEILLN